ncbi:MAG: alkaline phosphatase [Kiritimatiellae bacterium]|nr:alkaline phosphatase [Kiritimatiellia bacterium]
MRNSFAIFGVALVLAAAATADTPRNVILFIGDGMSTPQRMVAEEFSRKMGNGPLAINAFPCQGTTRTYSASSLVTDSAAASTAIACGEKTANGSIGVDAKGRRLESCAEAAKKSGRKVGIVTSVTINHATPAGFYAHQKSRSMLYEIGQDLVASGFDLFMGGGLAGKYNGKNGNTYDNAAKAGYMVAEGREGLETLKRSARPGDKVWWRVGEDALPYAIDAKGDGPRLPEITKFALDFLGDGFFLMVEGGRVDWAGHANEAAANLRDMLELDDAVKVALEFQKTHPDTLIVVTGDHETGGMTMGFAGTGYAFYMERLANQTCSTDAFRKRYHELKKQGADFDAIAALMTECYGFKFNGDGSDPMTLTDAEIKSLKRHYAGSGLGDKARRIMQDRAGVGWTSGSHTGLPALTTSIGPGSERFTGLMDNTDISKIMESFWR